MINFCCFFYSVDVTIQHKFLIDKHQRECQLEYKINQKYKFAAESHECCRCLTTRWVVCFHISCVHIFNIRAISTCYLHVTSIRMFIKKWPKPNSWDVSMVAAASFYSGQCLLGIHVLFCFICSLSPIASSNSNNAINLFTSLIKIIPT